MQTFNVDCPTCGSPRKFCPVLTVKHIVGFVCPKCGTYQVVINPLSENEQDKITYLKTPKATESLIDDLFRLYTKHKRDLEL